MASLKLVVLSLKIYRADPTWSLSFLFFVHSIFHKMKKMMPCRMKCCKVYERCRRIIFLLSLLFDNLITSIINAIGMLTWTIYMFYLSSLISLLFGNPINIAINTVLHIKVVQYIWFTYLPCNVISYIRVFVFVFVCVCVF